MAEGRLDYPAAAIPVLMQNHAMPPRTCLWPGSAARLTAGLLPTRMLHRAYGKEIVRCPFDIAKAALPLLVLHPTMRIIHRRTTPPANVSRY